MQKCYESFFWGVFVCSSNFLILYLKPVNLELIWLCKSRLRQPLTNVFSLISLKLQDLSVLWMLDHCSVASELLLARTDDFFSSHTQRRALGPWWEFSFRFAVGSLCGQSHLELLPPSPWLHQQKGRKCLNSGWTYAQQVGLVWK